jgi:microcystin-dependent protein
MKVYKVLLCLVFFNAYGVLNAQTANLGFNYQGYALNEAGENIKLTSLEVKFTIGNWSEIHTNVSTDKYGVFNAIIGSVNKDGFANIPFRDIDHTLVVETTISGSNTSIVLFSGPFSNVPYARSAANGFPVGTILAFAGNGLAPTGWLLCNGKEYNTEEYSQLYKAISYSWGGQANTFRVPDLRGQFLRGVDNATGIDPNAEAREAAYAGGNSGDMVGSTQGFATSLNGILGTNSMNHQHDYLDYYHNNPNYAAYGDNPPNNNPPNPKTNTTLEVPMSMGDRNYNDFWGFNLRRGGIGPKASVTDMQGIHGHEVVGGDAESRPINGAVQFIVKY